MDKENQALNSLNKISLKVNEKIQSVWKNQAFIKFYETKCDEIQKEIDQLNDENKDIDLLMENYEPENEQLEYCINSQTNSIKINHLSLINQELLANAQTDKLKEFKKLQDTILAQYDADIKKYEDKLKSSNDLYNELVEKKVKLKKIEINCMIIEQKSSETRIIQKEQTEIRKKIFYRDVVKFATWYLKESRIKEYQARLKIVKREENTALKELLTIQDQNRKFKQKQPFLPKPQQSAQSTQPPEKLNILEMLNKLNKTDKNLSALKNFNVEKSKVQILDIQTVRNATNQPPPEKPLSQSSLTSRFEKFISRRKSAAKEKPTNKVPQQPSSSENQKFLLPKFENVQENHNVAPKPNNTVNLSQMKSKEVLTPTEGNRTVERSQMTLQNNDKQVTFNFCHENPSQKGPLTCPEGSFNAPGYSLFGDNYSKSQEPVQNKTGMQYEMALDLQDDMSYLPGDMGPGCQSPTMMSEAYLNMDSPDFSMEENSGNPVFKMPNSREEENMQFQGFSGFKLY